MAINKVIYGGETLIDLTGGFYVRYGRCQATGKDSYTFYKGADSASEF